MEKLDYSVKISFSPGVLYVAKGIETLAPILARTYLLFLNDKEIEQLTGKDIRTGAEACINQGCHIVAVTLGKGTRLDNTTDASYIRDASNEYIIEPYNNEELTDPETTGAGDAFASGFLFGLLNGRKLNECGQLGDIVARFAISKIGARQGLPDLDALSRRYKL